MRYRKLDANGDYAFGHQLANFYIDQPEAVAQAVMTRLRLDLGAWFNDIADGTAWRTEVLGKYTNATRDAVIKERILGTPNVTSIAAYSSNFNTSDRSFHVTVTIDTAFGAVTVAGPI